MSWLFDLLRDEVVVLVQAVIALYIVVNPTGVASVFLGATKNSTVGQRRWIALVGSISGGVLLAAFAFAGTFVFQWFNITGASLQIAGGIFVFGIAFAQARGKEHEFFGKLNEAGDEGVPKSIAFYPVAAPLIAGPASITVVMTLSAKAADAQGRIVLLLAIGIVALLCFLAMGRLVKMEQRFGPALTLIWPRIMALVLAIIAVELILEGIQLAIPRFVEAVNTVPG